MRDDRRSDVAGDPVVIRPATPADARAIAAVYNHYVLETPVTFEEAAVSEGEMRARMAAGGDLPWLVLEQDGAIAGYAYARAWHARSAYRYSAESTIYLHHEAVGRGLGTRLYGALLDELARRPLHRVVGVIALPNPASVALHERLGFTPCGRLSEVGWKLGRWIDVGHWERALPGAGPRGGGDGATSSGDAGG